MNDFFIVAVDNQWGIAKDNKIPWYYPEDFKWFKEKTKNCNCIMGYNTFKEIAEIRGFPKKTGQLLPSRAALVVTSKEMPYIKSPYGPNKINLDDEWLKHISVPSVYIGGKRIYEYAIKNPSVLVGYITKIKKNYDCNMFFDNELLNEYFEFQNIEKETDNLVFEKWVRKYEKWVNKE